MATFGNVLLVESSPNQVPDKFVYPRSIYYTMNPQDPVTVVVTHRVVAGFEKSYEEWAQGITQAARTFDLALGVNLIRPQTSASPEYVIIFKFSSREAMSRWEASDERRQWAERRRLFTIDEPTVHHHYGWDYWFSLPSNASVAPPKYKMAFITWISIYPLALFMPMLLRPVTQHFHVAIEVLIVAAVIVPLMAWVIMPFMIRIFSKWLYPHD